MSMDIRNLRFLPIDVIWLYASEFNALASDKEWRAGINLILKSYHQFPAGTLPVDDVVLANLAGVEFDEWLAVKEKAMLGWEIHEDSRFHHPAVDAAIASLMPKRAAPVAESIEKPSDCRKSVWQRFIEIRIEKGRGPVTRRDLEMIRAEAKKVGLNLTEALSFSVEHNWASFRADWYISAKRNPKRSAPTSTRFGNQPAGRGTGSTTVEEGL